MCVCSVTQLHLTLCNPMDCSRGILSMGFCREEYRSVLQHQNDHHKICCFPGSSAGKESTCNAGDPGLIPESGRYPGDGIEYPPVFLGFPGGSDGKEYICYEGDLGLISVLGRSPGEGKG